MFAHVSANEITKDVPGRLNELARNGALWREVKYRQGSEIFGEAEPADYVSGRCTWCLSSIGAHCADEYDA
jgi:hypothetical protein